MTELQIKRDAIFDKDKNHRYILTRIWNENKPFVMFIGLNPSTANATEDDPTIRSVQRIANKNGFGGIYMVNCFPYISTNPKEMKQCSEQDIVINDKFILNAKSNCLEVVFAWGNFEIVKSLNRDKSLIELLGVAKCLGQNKNGSPKHPLYIKSETKFIDFKL